MLLAFVTVPHVVLIESFQFSESFKAIRKLDVIIVAAILHILGLPLVCSRHEAEKFLVN